MIILFDCSWKVWSELTKGSGVCWVGSLGNLEKLEAWCFEIIVQHLGDSFATIRTIELTRKLSSYRIDSEEIVDQSSEFCIKFWVKAISRG